MKVKEALNGLECLVFGKCCGSEYYMNCLQTVHQKLMELGIDIEENSSGNDFDFMNNPTES